MAEISTIEWTDSTWNPVTGCTKVSRGCDNCYAERFAERFRGVSGHPFATGFDLTLRWERLDQPLVWRRPRMIFVNSMSDLFHKEVPRDYVDRVFETMERATWHTFQVLTKRSSLMRDYLRDRYGDRRGPAHIWCGVSVEDRRAKSRIVHLRAAPAGLRFLSIEPLIGSLGEVDLSGIDWVIVGGESGPGARPMEPDWAREIRQQCQHQNVAFFFKQWGGLRPKSGGRSLDGEEWNQLPPRNRAQKMRAQPPDEVGPWAKEKLEALGRYLDFYTKVLKNQPWRTIYVDAYAGAGRAQLRAPMREAAPLLDDEPDAELVQLINGSPRVALEIENPFTRYVLIEPDPGRAAQLDGLRVQYGNTRQIDVLRQNAASAIEWLLTQNVSRRTHRGVVFLDPFGTNLDWSSIQALASTRVFEVVINFALGMAIQRMLPNTGEFQPGWRERLDAYFGTPEWYDAVYEKQPQLFGESVRKRDNYLSNLLSLYRERLKQAFGFVSQPKLIRNTRSAPLYYLLWAGPHRKGLEGADYILSMGENLPRRRRRPPSGG